MYEQSDRSRRPADLALALNAQMPLLQFQLNQMLAIMKWSNAMWALGQNQLSRCSTMLAGGVPIGA